MTTCCRRRKQARQEHQEKAAKLASLSKPRQILLLLRSLFLILHKGCRLVNHRHGQRTPLEVGRLPVQLRVSSLSHRLIAGIAIEKEREAGIATGAVTEETSVKDVAAFVNQEVVETVIEMTGGLRIVVEEGEETDARISGPNDKNAHQASRGGRPSSRTEHQSHPAGDQKPLHAPSRGLSYLRSSPSLILYTIGNQGMSRSSAREPMGRCSRLSMSIHKGRWH